MKRTIKLSIWGALIVFANHLNATIIDSSTDVNLVGSKSFELTMNNLKGNVKFSLLNSKQHVLYNENFVTTPNGILKKTFDLGLFPDGDYIIELTDSEKKQSLTISIDDNKLYVNKAEKTTHFLPVINKKNNIVRVNMPAFEEEYLEISIVNSEQTVVYQTRLNGNNTFGKVFDFSQAYRGTYKFQLSSKAGFVSKEIIIE